MTSKLIRFEELKEELQKRVCRKCLGNGHLGQGIGVLNFPGHRNVVDPQQNRCLVCDECGGTGML